MLLKDIVDLTNSALVAALVNSSRVIRTGKPDSCTEGQEILEGNLAELGDWLTNISPRN